MKISEKNAEQTSNDFQKGFNVGIQMNYLDSKGKIFKTLSFGGDDKVFNTILNIFKRHQQNSDISDPIDQELFAMLIEQELKLKKLIK